MTSNHNPARRDFLKTAAGTGAGLGLAAAVPAIVPSHVLGADAPSNKLVVAQIGVGWRGEQLMNDALRNPNIHIAALADVDRRFLMYAQNRLDNEYDVNRTPRVEGHRPTAVPAGAVDSYHDYRRILDRKDIDAVIIAVPDHWHAKASIDALEAGKDVYGEKPLSLTINQGRLMVRKTRQHGRIYQVGSQQRSSGRFRKACEYVRNGRLGKIHKVVAGIGGSPQQDPVPDEPVPPGLDWNTWLGPAPYVPYNRLRCHIEFRWFFEYSGGKMTDWGAHHCDIAQWGLGMDGSGPRTVEGTTELDPGYFNSFTRFEFNYTYASGVKLVVTSKGRNGITFYGEKGEIFVSRSEIEAKPADILEEPLKSNDVRLYKSDNHMQNWVDCVKSRELPITDVEIGHRSVTVCHLGNICGHLKRKLEWDPVREMFVNDSEANQMMDCEERAPFAVTL